MKTKTINQTITFPTSPDKLYALLVDSKKMTKIHGAKAAFSRRARGKFSVFDGYCHGYNTELAENIKIEQAWVFREDGWPEDHYSFCTFLLQPSTKGTKLVFIHKGVPEHKYETIKEGWKTYYWDSLQEHLLK